MQNLHTNGKDTPAANTLSVIVLNWNRDYLLRTTVLSLIATAKVPLEIIIADNASTDGSRAWIQEAAKNYPFISPLLLDRNEGGEALNIAAAKCGGELILISENDLEYLPGWDVNMIAMFSQFSDLGQLSPFSPIPQKELGEIWAEKPYKSFTREGITIRKADGNLGTSCMIRRKILDSGARWTTLESSNGVRFPADADFTDQVRNQGYMAAWSEKHQAINWGHNLSSWDQDRKYYLNNWKAKSERNIDGLAAMSQNEALSSEAKLEKLEMEIGKLTQTLTAAGKYDPRFETSILYVNTGAGFSNRQTITKVIDLNAGEFALEYDLNEFPEITGLRWDPVAEASCAIRITSVDVTAEGRTESVPPGQIEHNGEQDSPDGPFKFMTEDPSVFIPARGKLQSVRIAGNIGVLPAVIAEKTLKHRMAGIKRTPEYRVGDAVMHPAKFIRKALLKILKKR